MTRNEMVQLAFVMEQMRTGEGHWGVSQRVIAAFEQWDISVSRDERTDAWWPGPGGQIWQGLLEGN